MEWFLNKIGGKKMKLFYKFLDDNLLFIFYGLLIFGIVVNNIQTIITAGILIINDHLFNIESILKGIDRKQSLTNILLSSISKKI